MKKSFKFHVFIRICLVAFGIIFANRMLAQYFLEDQLRERTHQEMGMGLLSCHTHIDSQVDFLRCFNALEKGNVTNSISDFYVLCDKNPSSASSGSDQMCLNFQKQDTWWGKDKHKVADPRLDYANGMIDGVMWQGVRFKDKPNGPQIWLKDEHISDLMLQMWALRDRNLIYVLPTIITLLFALMFYIIYITLRPIAMLERTLAQLTARNLDQSTQLVAPFKEFEKVTQVFEDLRVRLSQSFTKARRFTSDASHELRTPLTILRGNAEQLIAELPVGSGAQVRMRLMSDEIERLIEITEKLLLLSRADANSIVEDLSDVDVSALLDDLIKDALSFHSKLKITGDIEPGIVWRCDKTLMNQLIHNLYVNAVNYNLPNGWIHIALKRVDGGFELTVENPTPEVPTDLTERAFDRFYRGDASHTRRVDGLGLGLSICLEIAKLHHSTLNLVISPQHTVLAKLNAPFERV
jgi:signal transduction histidine kinase